MHRGVSGGKGESRQLSQASPLPCSSVLFAQQRFDRRDVAQGICAVELFDRDGSGTIQAEAP